MIGIAPMKALSRVLPRARRSVHQPHPVRESCTRLMQPYRRRLSVVRWRKRRRPQAAEQISELRASVTGQNNPVCRLSKPS